MALTIIARYNTLWHAHIDRALLESEGLQAFLLDEHRVGINWFEGFAFGDIKLAVPTSQRESAEALFLARENGELEAALIKEHDLEINQCSRCGATAFFCKHSAADRAVQVLNFMLLGFFHPPHRGRLYCSTCGAMSECDIRLHNHTNKNNFN
jgi:ribosomal protein L37E